MMAFLELCRKLKDQCCRKLKDQCKTVWVGWCQVPALTPSPPSVEYMLKWIGSALIQIMACRLFGAKPLPETMLAPLLSIWLLGTNFSEIWIWILSFSFKKMLLKMLSVNLVAILSRGRWSERTLIVVEFRKCGLVVLVCLTSWPNYVLIYIQHWSRSHLMI